MATTIKQDVTLIATECCSCGVTFAMPVQLHETFKEKGSTFYCPSGHGQHFTEPIEKKLQNAKSEAYRMRRQAKMAMDEAKEYRQRYKSEKRSHAATKGHLTRAKKREERVANGVCPCCNRHFENLQRHMETEHPEYPEEN